MFTKLLAFQLVVITGTLAGSYFAIDVTYKWAKWYRNELWKKNFEKSLKEKEVDKEE